MKLPPQIHQALFKFFRPLRKKSRLLTISASVIIGIILYIGVEIGLAELVQQNSYPLHVLSAELLIEHGPDYAEESGKHEEMVRLYIDHMEQRQLAGVLRLLYPTYDPNKALASALSELSGLEKTAGGENDEKAKNVIRKAGFVSGKLCLRSRRFPQSPVRWFKSEYVQKDILSQLDKALEQFHKQVISLENAQNLNVDAVVTLCRDACKGSRRALLLLSLARLGYAEEEKITRFLIDLKRSYDLTLLLARTKRYESQKELLFDRARNMDLRAKVVEAMLDNDMCRASELLGKVIEGAFQKEKAGLYE